MEIKGICTALPAIVDQDRQLDLHQIVDCGKLLIQTGATTLVLFDQAGTGVILTQEQEQLMLDASRSICGDTQTPLVVVNTRRETSAAVSWARRIQQSAASAMIIVPPGDLDPQSEAMRAHLDQLCDAVQLPVLVQDHSRGARQSLSVSLLLELASRHANLLGFVIDTIPSGPAMDQLLQQLPHDRQVFLGNQPQHLTEAFHRGCAGAIAGPAVHVPSRKLWDALQQGDYATAMTIESKLLPLLTIIGQSDQLDAHYEMLILQQLGLVQKTALTDGIAPDPVRDMLFQQAYSQVEDHVLP